MAEVYLASRPGELPCNEVFEDGSIVVVHNQPVSRTADPRSPSAARTAFSTVAVDPLGERVLTSDRHGNLVLLDLNQQQYRRVRNMTIEATQALFSVADESSIFTTMTDSSVRCYSIVTGNMITTLQGHKSDICSIAQNGDGSLLLTASADVALLWSTKDWTRKRSLGALPGIAHATFAPAAGYLALAFKDDSIVVWESSTYEVVARLRLTDPEAGAGLKYISCADDGSLVVAAASSGCVYVWDTRSQALVRIIDAPAPAKTVIQVHVIPSATATEQARVVAEEQGTTTIGVAPPQIAMLDDEGRLLIVELGPQVCTAVLELEAPGGRGKITQFALSQDARLLAVVTDDGRLVLYDVPRAKVYRMETIRSQGQTTTTGQYTTTDDSTSGAAGGPDGGLGLSYQPLEGEEEASMLYAAGDVAAPVAGGGGGYEEEASILEQGPLAGGDGGGFDFGAGAEQQQQQQRSFLAAPSFGPPGGQLPTSTTLTQPMAAEEATQTSVDMGALPTQPFGRGGYGTAQQQPASPTRIEQDETGVAAAPEATATTAAASAPSQGFGSYDILGDTGTGLGGIDGKHGRQQPYPAPQEQHFNRHAEGSQVDVDTGYVAGADQQQQQQSVQREQLNEVLREGDVAGMPDVRNAQRQQQYVDGFGARDRGSGSAVRASSEGAAGIAARSRITGGAPGTATRYAASGGVRASVGPSPPLPGPGNAPLHDLIGRATALPRGATEAAAGLPIPGQGQIPDEAVLAAAANTHKKLRSLLDAYGAYPAKYRKQAWRFLLRLPRNEESFRALVDRGSHPAWNDLEDRYPVRDRRLLTRLAKTVNALAHWSPVFGEVPFLPVTAFPFVKFFGSVSAGDDITMLEGVMAVLVNWGSHWVEALPHPPIPILGRLHALLMHWDAPLARHLEACGADPVRYAWPMLRSCFSEVLTRPEWEQLWDHLITHAHDPSLLLYAVVAYLRYFRGPLLGIRAPNTLPQPHPGGEPGHGQGGLHGPFRSGHGRRSSSASAATTGSRWSATAGSPAVVEGAPFLSAAVGFNGPQSALAAKVITPSLAEICTFLRHQNPINMSGFLGLVYDMRRATPAHAHPYPVAQAERILTSTSAGNVAASGPPGGSGAGAPVPAGSPFAIPDLRHDGPASGSGASSSSSQPAASPSPAVAPSTPSLYSGPLHALPQGHYPPFLRYPRFIIDYQLAERRRIAMEEEALRKRRLAATMLEQRTLELEAEEAAWRAERQMLAAAEVRRASEAEWASRLRDREQAAVEAEISANRVAAAASSLETAKQSIAVRRAQAVALASRSEVELRRIGQARDRMLASRMQDEALSNIESQAAERIAMMRERSGNEDAEAAAAAALEAARRRSELELLAVGEAWRSEDDVRRIARMRAADVQEQVGIVA